jgi:hypothetical protein
VVQVRSVERMSNVVQVRSVERNGSKIDRVVGYVSRQVVSEG